MSYSIQLALRLSWLIVIFFWIISSRHVKKSHADETIGKQILFNWLPLLIAALLLGPGEWYGHSWLRENFVPHSNEIGIMGLFCCFSGTLIACIARFQLRHNWSFSVQQKQQHELIQQGLYKTIRHPIYTGLLLLFIGNAIIVGDYRAILAVVIVVVSFWVKLRKEEKLLTTLFGQQYIDYLQRTKALIPFIL